MSKKTLTLVMTLRFVEALPSQNGKRKRKQIVKNVSNKNIALNM